MKKDSKYQGTVVPMVTPFTADGRLDEPSLDRLVDSLLAGGIEGIFVMGTTGEGVAIPEADRRRIVAQTVARTRGAVKVFAGISNGHLDENKMGNDYLRDGADALVLHPRLAGIKDSEKDSERLKELLEKFGGQKDFSVFVGVGALMEKGLKLGADGIVPSVGNLIPQVCHQLCESAKSND